MRIVSRRGGFSDRNEIKKENTIIQLDNLDERTRKQLATYISAIYNSLYKTYYDLEKEQRFCKFVLSEVYSETTDYRKIYDINSVFDSIFETVLEDDYDSVLTMVESLAQFWNTQFPGYVIPISKETIFSSFNLSKYQIFLINSLFIL